MIKDLFFQYLWLIEIALIPIGYYLLNCIFSRLMRKKTAHFKAIIMPGRVLLGVLLLAFCLQVLSEKVQIPNFSSAIPSFRNLGIVVCLTWWGFRWKDLALKLLSKKLKKTDLPIGAAFIDISKKLLNVLIIYVALLVALPVFGMDIMPFVTFGGIGAAAMGFAAKDILANYVNGFILHIARPFAPGDLIHLPDKKIQGQVEEIGWCLTSIRDEEKNPIFVPNAFFTSAVTINLSRKKK